MILTVFTPTFNRRELLKRVYEHLCCQTSKDFIWLVIDDGSTDGTSSQINVWQHEHIINIKYVYQENGGKMRAHNRAVELSETELFLCVDSDDYLVDHAVEQILKLWDSLTRQMLISNIAGIVAYKGRDTEHTMNAEHFPEIEFTTLTGLYQNGFSGETTLVYKTQLLKKHLFPVFEGEKFMPEAIVYDQIDLIGPLYVYPYILTISSYQQGGLTRSIRRLRKNNPNGWLLYYNMRIAMVPLSVLRYKYVSHAICFSWFLKGNIFQQVVASPIEVMLAIPAAFILKLFGKL